MKKIVLIIVVFLALLVTGIFVYLQLKVKNYTQKIELPQLHQEAKIIFDAYGIPHIYAANTEDAYRLLGYVQASDRLFQMELLRRVGAGRLSEILGPDLLETDKFIRTVGLNENAQKAVAAFENDTNEVLKKNVYAFLAGVNEYVKNGTTPIEFEILGIPKTPFEVIDIYRILGYMGFGFSMELQNEPLFSSINNYYGPQYLADLGLSPLETDTRIPVKKTSFDTLLSSKISTPIYKVLQSFPVPLFYGSNSWVISGSKTKSGKVLFANDTHIGFSQPSVWYEAHIETPDLRLYGNFLAGIPFPIVGHTMHHSWGLTIFPNDAIDLYKETISGDSVMYKNEWTALQHRTETIHVKNQPDVEYTVTTTPHGPIISELDKFSAQFDNPVSMFWVSNQVVDKKLHAISLLATTHKFEDIEIASRAIDSPGLNLMYGDSEGNIGWFGSAKLIMRPPHVNSKIVLDGASGLDEPLGFYPYEFNPKSINPETGFVYSANNPPDSVNGVFYPGYYYAGARAKVISTALAAKNDWDIESMKTLVLDNKSPVYPANVQVILSQISAESASQKAVVKALSDWDGQHQLTDVGPTIYYKLIYHILKKSWADEMGETQFEQFLTTPVYLHAFYPFIRNENSVWWDNVTTDSTETRQDIFQSAFNQTATELVTQLGENVQDWTWGKVHFIEHPHPLGKKKPLDKLFNVGPFPASGGEEVVNKMAFILNNQGIYTAKSGPAMRILMDFADVENSISINPTGQSGYFRSTQYDDQAQMYVNGEFRKQLMNAEEIESKNSGVWNFYSK